MESGEVYQPSEKEIKDASYNLTLEQRELSGLRETDYNAQECFKQNSEIYERYLNLSGSDKIDASITLADEGVVREVYGGKLPGLVYPTRTPYMHDEPSGLQSVVQSCTKAVYFSEKGYQQVNDYRFISDNRIEASKKFLDVYWENIERFMEKSKLLNALITPVKERRKLTDEDFNRMKDVGFDFFEDKSLRSGYYVFRKGVDQEYASRCQYYYDFMSSGYFESVFCEVAKQLETPEGFSAWKQQAEQALSELEAAE